MSATIQTLLSKVAELRSMLPEQREQRDASIRKEIENTQAEISNARQAEADAHAREAQRRYEAVRPKLEQSATDSLVAARALLAVYEKEKAMREVVTDSGLSIDFPPSIPGQLMAWLRRHLEG